MKALVIDDSKAIRMILAKILSDIGFEVCEAVNGRDALEKIADSGPPDLIFVDWNMPEINGFEFVQAVKKNPNYANIPLMMITTESDCRHLVAAQSAGVVQYVTKPFTTETILQKLHDMGFKSASSSLDLLKKIKYFSANSLDNAEEPEKISLIDAVNKLLKCVEHSSDDLSYSVKNAIAKVKMALLEEAKEKGCNG